ncbi:MAG: T9SS type A sorting domain-containing protein, partial [Flavobacterium sp.]|nr:T9SS type A sorting domain-containing protein [Flavobacterium sp.]
LIPVAGCVLGSETFESKNGFKVSPNPSNSIFNLDLTSNYKTIVVADLLGKVVFSKNINNLASVAVDLRSLESGCYIAKLINDSGSVNVKLLKN